jgi:hypothetical protein
MNGSLIRFTCNISEWVPLHQLDFASVVKVVIESVYQQGDRKGF